ncbi:MAG: hypothetical protein NTX74_04170 [Flavobacterium sp.]|nr:hypothetical protein [Flavobacterium sp.]
MTKKILLSLLLMVSFMAVAQQSTSSPYSFYGIGEIRFKGTVENRLMGGLSFMPDSIHVSIQNPASYSYLKLTTFTVGGSFNSGTLRTFTEKEKTQRSTLDYLAVAIPLKKSGFSFGLIPYSAVGYRIRNTVVDTIQKFEGTGGVNKVFFGYGYQLKPNLSIGAEVNYNFGEIQTNSLKYINGIQFGVLEENTTVLSGFNYKIGLLYQRKIEKIDFYSGLHYNYNSNLNTTTEQTISSVTYSEYLSPLVVDELSQNQSTARLHMPNQISIGAGIGKTRNWMIGTEFTWNQSSAMGNRYDNITVASFKNGYKYSLGGFWIPNYNAFSNYFQKITYRTGFRYENTGLVIQNQTIKDYAFTAGFGLPLGGTFSNLNIGVEYGQKGTVLSNLVRENYTNVVMSLSLNDKWFVKRKYD